MQLCWIFSEKLDFDSRTNRHKRLTLVLCQYYLVFQLPALLTVFWLNSKYFFFFLKKPLTTFIFIFKIVLKTHNIYHINHFIVQLYQQYHIVQPISRFFSSCKVETLYPFNSTSPLPLPIYHLATTILLSVTVILSTLGTSYKQNHVVFIFLWLAYFMQHNVFKSSSILQHGAEFPSFVRLNSIPLQIS